MTTATLPLPASLTARSEAVTPDDLLLLERHGLYELVDGELVEKPPMGFGAGKVASFLFRRIGDYAEAHDLGVAVFEVSFRCFPSRPDQVRRPDIAFIAAARLAGVPDDGHVRVRPDLAVEVVSPGDNVYDLDAKLLDYAGAAVPLVWVVNPAARIVRVFRPGRPIDQLGDGDTLDGDEVLPGFAVGLGEVFGPRPVGD